MSRVRGGRGRRGGQRLGHSDSEAAWVLAPRPQAGRAGPIWNLGAL